MGKKKTNCCDKERLVPHVWDSAYINTATYNLYYRRLRSIALQAFQWDGFPDTIDTRFLERCLFDYGKACVFVAEGEIPIVLPFNQGGNFDVYGYPTEREVYAINGYHKTVNYKNSIIIYNNDILTPGYTEIEGYAFRLYTTERAIDVNINAQKTPIMILCDENERLTMKNMYEKYDGNEPFIFGSNNPLRTGTLQALNTSAPYVADRLQTQKEHYWNEALVSLGVPSMFLEKKERLVTNEASYSMGGVMASRNAKLMMRQEACKQINNMFGWNVSVKYRDYFEEEFTNGDIHDTSENDMRKPD